MGRAAGRGQGHGCLWYASPEAQAVRLPGVYPREMCRNGSQEPGWEMVPAGGVEGASGDEAPWWGQQAGCKLKLSKTSAQEILLMAFFHEVGTRRQSLEKGVPREVGGASGHGIAPACPRTQVYRKTPDGVRSSDSLMSRSQVTSATNTARPTYAFPPEGTWRPSRGRGHVGPT